VRGHRGPRSVGLSELKHQSKGGDTTMTDYEVKLNNEAMSNLLTSKDGLAQLIEEVLNQVLEAQVTEHLQAERYERSDDRMGYRNGYRLRTLYMRVGRVTLRVPQLRDGSFSTSIFRRYQRSEQAFVLGLMEMYVNGVSMGKVKRITEELCGVSFSRSTVSQLCMELDAKVRKFNERKLDEYPFLIIDAMHFKAREDDCVIGKAAMLISGVNARGIREPLGVRIGDSESEAFWKETFDWLKERGLNGVRFVVSDEHAGLVKAVRRSFIGAIWQRCQVHFMRNILGHIGRRVREELAEDLKPIFRTETVGQARELAQAFIEKWEAKAPRATACLEEGLEDALAVMALPAKYRRRLRTTNMQERLIQEIRRRERVIRIFPNEDSALRLFAAMLAETHEAWLTRKYLDMDEFYEWLDEKRNRQGGVIAMK